VSPEWDWRFRILRARILLSQSQPKDALALLKDDLPPSLLSSDLAIRRTLYQGTSYRYLQQTNQAEQKLMEAEQLAASLRSSYLCDVLIARAQLQVDQEQYAAAEENLNRAVALSMAFGPAVGLELVDTLTGEPSLKAYHLLPSVRGDFLFKLARFAEARAEFERAASLTRNARERALLLDRAAACAREASSPPP
jgi:tetratricopeptide (TPR) repeat protein